MMVPNGDFGTGGVTVAGTAELPGIARQKKCVCNNIPD